MTNVDNVYRGSVGMEKILRNLIRNSWVAPGTHELVSQPNDGFPFYNIVRTDEHTYELIIALAGYSEEDIEITLENRELVVSSKGLVTSPEVEEYIHRGFTSKAFNRKFVLGADVEIVETNSNNGLLTIVLEHKVPDSSKKQTIKVGENRSKRTQLNG